MNNKQQPLVPDLARVRPFDDRSSTNPAVSIPRNICMYTNKRECCHSKEKKRGRLEVETFAIIKIKCLTRRWQLVVVVVVVIMKRLSLTATLPFPSPFFLLLSPVESNLCINLIEFAAPFAHSQRKRKREREKQRTHRERRIK